MRISREVPCERKGWNMQTNRSGRAWRRPVVGFLVSMLTFAILTPAQQGTGNRVAQGVAAEIGQKVPGPSGGPDLPRADGTVPVAVQDPAQARQERVQRQLRFDKMKEQAGQLAEMAKSLQEEIEKSNENILAADVTEKAKKIEKLAGKIRSESRY